MAFDIVIDFVVIQNRFIVESGRDPNGNSLSDKIQRKISQNKKDGGIEDNLNKITFKNLKRSLSLERERIKRRWH